MLVHAYQLCRKEAIKYSRAPLKKQRTSMLCTCIDDTSAVFVNTLCTCIDETSAVFVITYPSSIYICIYRQWGRGRKPSLGNAVMTEAGQAEGDEVDGKEGCQDAFEHVCIAADKRFRPIVDL